VRPGDRVNVRILRDSILEYSMLVGPRGFIVAPFVGDVHMVGVPGNSVQDSVRSSLSRVIAPTAVEVTLLRRVRVMGEVARPGIFYVTRVENVRDALALAGGPTGIGRPYELVIERDGQRMRIEDWRTDSLTLQPVHSGDQVTVPRLPWYMQNILYAATTAATLVITIAIALAR
jgi:protein involved in polysaccharide export with SLBB domain